MIFVFGSILQSITLHADTAHESRRTQFADNYHNSVGGKGAIQALAAAKAGAKTALIGRTGDDELAKHILLRLRKHGVITSGVSKAEKMQTGTAVTLTGERRTILALGASAKASADQVPEETLSERHIVLLQTELDPGENTKILQMAKDAGATTIVNSAPRKNLTDENLDNVDYLIAPVAQKEKYGDLQKHNNITAIFLKPDGSCELMMPGAPASTIPKLALEDMEWNNLEGSMDAFCGTFAAGLYSKRPMDKVILHAHIAATITASRPGGYDAVPYIDEVHECIKRLSEGKE